MLPEDVWTRKNAEVMALCLAVKLMGLQMGLWQKRMEEAPLPGGVEYWNNLCEKQCQDVENLVKTLFPDNDELLMSHLESFTHYAQQAYDSNIAITL